MMPNLKDRRETYKYQSPNLVYRRFLEDARPRGTALPRNIIAFLRHRPAAMEGPKPGAFM